MCQVRIGTTYVALWSFFFSLLFLHTSDMYFPASGQAVVTGVVPCPPRFLPSIFIAHRVQQSYCSSIFRRVWLTHDLLALSACHFVLKKKTPRIYTSTHSGGFELMKLTRTRLGINLISHRGDRLITCALLLLTTAATAAVVPIPSSSPLAEYEKRNPVINALATGTPFWGHEYSIGRDFGGSKEVLSKQKNATKYIDDTTQTASSGWRRRAGVVGGQHPNWVPNATTRGLGALLPGLSSLLTAVFSTAVSVTTSSPQWPRRPQGYPKGRQKGRSKRETNT